MVSERARILALIVAENVLTDLEGRRSLVGMFNGIAGPSYPINLPRMAIFILADTPSQQLTLEFSLALRDHPEVVVHKQDFTLDPHPTAYEAEIGFVFAGAVWPQPGEYICQIRQDGKTLISRRITAKLLTETLPASSAAAEARA